jgi:hypothetical protein
MIPSDENALLALLMVRKLAVCSIWVRAFLSRAGTLAAAHVCRSSSPVSSSPSGSGPAPHRRGHSSDSCVRACPPQAYSLVTCRLRHVSSTEQHREREGGREGERERGRESSTQQHRERRRCRRRRRRKHYRDTRDRHRALPMCAAGPRVATGQLQTRRRQSKTQTQTERHEHSQTRETDTGPARTPCAPLVCLRHTRDPEALLVSVLVPQHRDPEALRSLVCLRLSCLC